MKWTKAVMAAVLTLGVALGATGQAEAQKIIKLHHLNNDDPFDNATGAMAQVFKSLVEAGTNGSVEVQTIGILDMPFAFPNISVTYKVFDGPFGEKLAADIEQQTGMKVLGFGDSGGFFAFTNSRRLIRSPEDLKGLKIRTMGLETHKRMVSSLGGQPTAIAWAEVYTALQTGVADGQMNPVPIISFAKFDEVQKYLTLSGHLFAPYVWVINKGFWDDLTPAEQDVVQYAARSAIVAGRGISRIIEASDRGLPALAKNMEVYTPTAEEKAAFREAAQPAVREYIVKTFGAKGEEMLNAFLDAIEKASAN